MTPKLYPVIESVSQFGLQESHLTIEVNGSRTCVPVGLALSPGDSLCVVPSGFSAVLFATNVSPHRNGHGLAMWAGGRLSRIRKGSVVRGAK